MDTSFGVHAAKQSRSRLSVFGFQCYVLCMCIPSYLHKLSASVCDCVCEGVM